MYLLLIFNDPERTKINSIRLYESMKQIIIEYKGFLQYNDLLKRKRYYKTCKSFFYIKKINYTIKSKYFTLH
jgi:hypothetical protein